MPKLDFQMLGKCQKLFWKVSNFRMVSSKFWQLFGFVAVLWHILGVSIGTDWSHWWARIYVRKSFNDAPNAHFVVLLISVLRCIDEEDKNKNKLSFLRKKIRWWWKLFLRFGPKGRLIIKLAQVWENLEWKEKEMGQDTHTNAQAHTDKGRRQGQCPAGV